MDMFHNGQIHHSVCSSTFFQVTVTNSAKPHEDSKRRISRHSMFNVYHVPCRNKGVRWPEKDPTHRGGNIKKIEISEMIVLVLLLNQSLFSPLNTKDYLYLLT